LLKDVDLRGLWIEHVSEINPVGVAPVGKLPRLTVSFSLLAS